MESTMVDKIKKVIPKEFVKEIDKLSSGAIRRIYDEIIELEKGSENFVSIKSLEVNGISVKVEFNPIKDYYPTKERKKDYNSYSLLFDMLEQE